VVPFFCVSHDERFTFSSRRFAFNIAVEKLLSFFSTGAPSLIRFSSGPSWPPRCRSCDRAAVLPGFLGRRGRPAAALAHHRGGRGIAYSALLLSRFLATPIHTGPWFHAALVIYVFVGLYLSVYYLYRRYRGTPSRVEKIRLLYLLIGGVATVTAALLDLIPGRRRSETSSSPSTCISYRRPWPAIACSTSTSCSAVWWCWPLWS